MLYTNKTHVNGVIDIPEEENGITYLSYLIDVYTTHPTHVGFLTKDIKSTLLKDGDVWDLKF